MAPHAVRNPATRMHARAPFMRELHLLNPPADRAYATHMCCLLPRLCPPRQQHTRRVRAAAACAALCALLVVTVSYRYCASSDASAPHCTGGATIAVRSAVRRNANGVGYDHQTR